ncbi:ferredoxin/adrenodoxin [Anaeramoeba ignava]|uniref:Ferredoxin/adrenodoxin n=1 Tax=Anaeramoeba ignava TaxID=1746090 RepID=A0A9Q0RE79_ANAIG|nr:ferredoxin/adrenodoxin [Anaeramoeba ignava]|eukprot:Anaeramoba_ignava/a612099_158.p1 GENE.a612099_158~~a612099_158.p1  ORF type:complete len:135 (-),score=50.32 a612099_158:201-605(-)
MLSIIKKETTPKISQQFIKTITKRLMSSLTVIDREGKKNKLEFDEGMTLYEAADEAKMKNVLGTCGGNMACGRCQVYVKQSDLEKLDPAEEEETQTIKDRSFKPQPNSRLACAMLLTEKANDIEVTLAPLKGKK